MAYNKTTWETGDVITAEKLNNIENGIAAIKGVMSITLSEDGDTATLSATWQQISDAFGSMTPVFVYTTESSVMAYMVVFAEYDPGNDKYDAGLFDCQSGQLYTYSCPSADDYPSFTFT